MTEQATLNENVSENDLTCEILLTVGKYHDRRPWPETRIFIEMDSACMNLQGNCNYSAGPFFVIFLALWLNLCNNSDQTLFFMH